MRCAWQAYLGILPLWMREDVDALGKDKLRELRLRIGLPPELVLQEKSIMLRRQVRREDLEHVIHTASKYSAWSRNTSAYGFLTAQGGHRIGICGETIVEEGHMRGIRYPTSLCIRTAREFPGIAKGSEDIYGSVLMIGPPGSGKTTLLREWIRVRSRKRDGSICVVDERGELFPSVDGSYCFDIGPRTDILSGCTKVQGIDCVLRTMTPTCIAVDEITSEEDCDALIRSMWSGVDLLATAHASSVEDLQRRKIYCRLMEANLFQTVIVLDKHQNWHTERIRSCILSG